MIKVKEAEKRLINDAKNFREEYTIKLECIEHGIKLTKSILNLEEENERIEKILECITKLEKCIGNLQINSEVCESGEEILWFSCRIEDFKEIYCRDNVSTAVSTAIPVTEKNIIYCLMTFQLEVCELISTIKTLQDGFNNYFWESFEKDLSNTFLSYVNKICFE